MMFLLILLFALVGISQLQLLAAPDLSISLGRDNKIISPRFARARFVCNGSRAHRRPISPKSAIRELLPPDATSFTPLHPTESEIKNKVYNFEA